MIGNVMQHSYYIMNFYTHLDLLVTTRLFEILRRCGPISKPEIWGNHLEIICIKEPRNGCGHVRNAPKSINVLAEEEGDIAAVNAKLF
tara:strand:- start:188 stop:451 length:264 start_codon:yes stop_codon:yes gene_type:complete